MKSVLLIESRAEWLFDDILPRAGAAGITLYANKIPFLVLIVTAHKEPFAEKVLWDGVNRSKDVTPLPASPPSSI